VCIDPPLTLSASTLCRQLICRRHNSAGKWPAGHVIHSHSWSGSQLEAWTARVAVQHQCTLCNGDDNFHASSYYWRFSLYFVLVFGLIFILVIVIVDVKNTTSIPWAVTLSWLDNAIHTYCFRRAILTTKVGLTDWSVFGVRSGFISRSVCARLQVCMQRFTICVTLVNI